MCTAGIEYQLTKKLFEFEGRLVSTARSCNDCFRFVSRRRVLDVVQLRYPRLAVLKDPAVTAA